MKGRWQLGILMSFAVLAIASIAFVRGSRTSVEDVLSSDHAVAQQAVAALREAGPQGLAAVLRNYDRTHDARLLPVIDAVAAQRDAVWSRLYWYTDLERAKAAAQVQKKPILYLRLMGKLTDEYSCANSRFFRTVLYANRDVSKLLREQFILVWASERPAPVVTIDYGDGRVLMRTLTGNSIHYVLTPDGKVVDALPGLYAPQTFDMVLVAARNAALALGDASRFVQYASRADDWLLRQWIDDRARTGAPAVSFVADGRGAKDRNPNALRAMPLAVSKSAVEMPLLRRISSRYGDALDQTIESSDAAIWEKIAGLHLPEAQLDPASIALIRSKNPAAYSTPDSLQRTVSQFEHTIALDAVHNNYQLRRRILGWLRESKSNIELEDLNRRVYSELFLTPRTDPWLGLMPEATYTALPEDGVSAAEPAVVPADTEAFDCIGHAAGK